MRLRGLFRFLTALTLAQFLAADLAVPAAVAWPSPAPAASPSADATGQPVTVSHPNVHAQTSTYDANGNLSSVTDANGHAQTFTFDAANRVLTSADALGNTTHYSYDAAGNPTQTTLPSGAINRQGYDDRNRLVGIDPGNTGNFSIQYAYDQAGRRTSMADATGTTTYGYDAANRLTSVTAPGTGQVQYAYDAAGERTSLTYPSGHQVSYGYTARGQLQSVTDWNAKETGYTYDNAGQLTAISFPNGVSGSLGYDNADRLTSIAYTQGSTGLENIAYTRDAVGDPTAMTDSTGTTTYGYDALDRLTGATYPNSDAVSYAYDPVGNRTSLTVNGVQTTSTFDVADRLTQAGSTTYTYDQNGNELTKTAGGVITTYGYDPLNRLTGISEPTTASYAYNGDGLRTSKTVNGTTTSYAWDPTGLGTVLGDGTGEYLWGQGLVSQVTSSATTYAQSDGLGSVRLLTDSSGAVAGRQSFDAYGASRSQSGIQLPFGFTGEQTDAESGLVYLRARYMDPSSGRFLNPDPLGLAGGSTNLYAYVQDRPTSASDRSGRDACEAAMDDGACSGDSSDSAAPAGSGGDALVLVAAAWWLGGKIGGAIRAGAGAVGQAVANACPWSHSEATTPAGPSGPNPSPTPGPGGRAFTSKDKYVGQLANAIEAQNPGSVVAVNQRVIDATGREVGEFDVETNDFAIQVKSGNARNLGAQIRDTMPITSKRVIGYAPDLSPDSPQVKAWAREGWTVYTDEADLLRAISTP